MFRLLGGRTGHYALLVLLAGTIFLANLGGPSLWDIDEGNNAEASREMMERGDWVVPTFNFELRTDKPALLYWLQIGSYRMFGVNEAAARLPSAVAALFTVLLVYELGRLLFGAAAGLLAGVILASTVMFGAAAHFANPDALLNLFTALTLFLFWRGYSRASGNWFIPAGLSAGFAMLAKGPVGLVLPGAVVLVFLLWERRLLVLRDWRLGLGFIAFLLVAAPWYALVGADTKGEFLRGFFLTHNFRRFGSAMENHGGPIYYYLLVLLVGFAPWSAFVGPAGWYGIRLLRSRPTEEAAAYRASLRFLWCWVAVYFVFFSASGTKLPNYILPLYPPTALLTAHFLDGWRRGLIQPPPWVMRMCLLILALTGVVFSAGTLLASGVLPLSFMRGRFLPGLQTTAILGLVLLWGAIVARSYLVRRQPTAVMTACAASASLFLAALLAWAGPALNTFKAPRTVAALIAAHQTEREIRIGSYQYFQPSLVFYARHQVDPMYRDEDVLEFLESPLAAYLVVPAPAWDELQGRVRIPYRVIGRQRDLYKHCDVVVVTNR
jgi:4-amino-4-deoxy-L-arabinose transferase-like glycosyltransferase